jgi:hypothetical protein
VSGRRSNPKRTNGGAFLKCHRMRAWMTFVAAIFVRYNNPIRIGW